MSDHERYYRYVAWCERIGVRPASFEGWLHTNRSIDAKWGAIWQLNMGRRR